MNRKKLLCLVCLGLLVVGFSWPAFACEFGKRAEIMVKAPLDAVNCGATPPTITVLGRNIDISLASLFSGGHGSLTCSDLTAGQVVKVTLASDNPVPSAGNLLASAVELEGGGCTDSDWGGVMIAAPIQAIDTSNPSAPTVQVLGLTVNVSQALILNNDDDGPLNISQVAAGQFAFLMLPSNQTPLSATFLGVHQVQIKVRDSLTAVNCGSTSSTITTALGLNIDITSASLYDANENPIKCDDLAAMPANQVVTVTLASDSAGTNGFPATEVETARNSCSDSNCGNVMIFAPIQVIDTSNPSAPTVQVLGLPINIANAFPQCDAGNCSITLNQWEVGEFAMLILPSTQPPLSASFMWVHLVEIKVKAPLTAVNCSATPPSITVLGLNIDISNTNLYNDGGSGCGWDNNLTCANLTPGQEVTVTLSSDTPNSTTSLFPATKVEMEEGCCWFGWCDLSISNVKIAAPIQNISGTIVTVLEQLNIDTKNAILELDNGLPMNASQLAVGQFVKLTLVPNTSSLSALILVAQASAVQATVQALDNKGKKVNDGANNDITAQVTVGQGKHARVYNFSGNGTFYLSGLPVGTAKIVVTRIYNGQKSTGTGSFTVKAVKANNKKGYNKPQYLTIRLKPVRQ